MTRPLTGTFARLTLGCTALLLAACSQTPAPAPSSAGDLPPGSPYADGRQYPWSDRLDAAGAEPYADGRTYDWASPTAASGVNAQALGAGRNYLSDLQWTSASSGWGPVERDRSNGEQGKKDGTALKVGGRVFAKGLGVHAASEIRYALGGQCQTFTAFVGIDEEVGGRGSAQFRVLGDGKVLFDSGVRRGRDLSLPVNVSVAGVKELRLSVSDGGDNNHYDHADWGEAAVECAAAQPEGDVFLSDLPYASATSGWGPVEFDRSNGSQAQFDGRPLTIGGRVFAKGLGTHAFSVLSYDLGGRCNTFSAQLGLDDEVGARGSVVFQVYGDDRKLYDSGVLRGSDAARRAAVRVDGVKVLKLIVTDAGDNIDYDHADWADARLSCAPAPAGQAGTPDASFGTAGRVAVGGVDVVAEPGGPLVVLDADFKVTRLSQSGAVLAQSAALPGGVAEALVRQPDGKLVAVGRRGNEAAAVRYLNNLTLDPSFGVGGTVRLVLSEPGSANFSARTTGSKFTDVAIQPDGRIVLGGYAQRVRPGSESPSDLPTTADLALTRLQSDGSSDPTFGTGGVVITSLNGNSLYDQGDVGLEETISGLALQPDGKIVVVGESSGAASYYALLGRYLPSGQLDLSFGTRGFVGTSGYSAFRDVVVQPDGKIVVAGATDRFLTSGLVERFNPDGSSDRATAFTLSGEVNFYKFVLDHLTLASNGDLYATDGAVVLRFRPDLTRDSNFEVSVGVPSPGTVPPYAPPSFEAAAYTGSSDNALIVDLDGKIVALNGTTTVRLFR